MDIKNLIFKFCVLLIPLTFSGQELLAAKDCLPSHLAGKNHSDFPPGLRWIPRSITVWCMVEPPKKILGNQKDQSKSKDGKTLGPKPIPQTGKWQFSVVRVKKKWPIFLPYFAITVKNIHFRLGARWDDVDHYYAFPSISLKKTKKNKNLESLSY